MPNNRQAAAMVLEVAYGFQALPEKDPYMQLAEQSMAYNIIAATGRYWVETIPWLKFVPAWVPGAGFKRVALEARKVMEAAIDIPFEDVQKAMVSNIVSWTTFC